MLSPRGPSAPGPHADSVGRKSARVARRSGRERHRGVAEGAHAQASKTTPACPSATWPITGKPARSASPAATTAHMPMPRLKTRRCSSSVDALLVEPRDRPSGRSQAPGSIRAPSPSGSDARQVARDPAAGDVRERPHVARAPEARARPRGRAASGRAAGRRRTSPSPTSRRTSEKPFACSPEEGRPTTTSPASTREPSMRSRARDEPDARPGEVELALAVDARHLGRLAAEERAAGLAADLGRALDELRHLLRGRGARPPRSRGRRAGRPPSSGRR